MTDHAQVKCAASDVPIEGSSVDPQLDDRFTCPNCGIGDTYENVMREVKEYVAEKLKDSFSRSIKDIADKSEFMDFKQDPQPKKHYRFIVDTDL